MSTAIRFQAILTLAFLTGCQSPAHEQGLEQKVGQQFDQTMPLDQFVQRFNDEYAFAVSINASAGHPSGEWLAASQQPPITTEEVVTAMRVALANGYEERGLASIDGATGPRPLEPFTVLTLRRILESGEIPERYDIDVQVSTSESQVRYWTYIPTIRLPFNDIVIRQVYLSSESAMDGNSWVRGEAWLKPDLNRNRVGADELTMGD